MPTPIVTLSLNYSDASDISLNYNFNNGYILTATVTDSETGSDMTNQGTYMYNINNQNFISISNSELSNATLFTTAVGGPTEIFVRYSQKGGSENLFVRYYSNPIRVTVIKGEQYVTFSPVGTKAVGDAPVSLTAYVTGNDSANYGAITYSSNNPSVVDISGSTATFLSAGSSELQALAAETDYYNQGVSDPQTVNVTGGGGGGIPCFTAGTMIRVPTGEVAVETLKAGDLVVTSAGRTVPLKAVLTTHVEKTTVATAPYLIPAATYGSAQPRELVLSPAHAFQIRKGVWLAPCAATKLNPAVRQIRVGEEVTYYHLECPVFLRDNLVANGCVTESFGSRQMTKHPYTWSARLGGFTRSPASSHVARA